MISKFARAAAWRLSDPRVVLPCALAVGAAIVLLSARQETETSKMIAAGLNTGLVVVPWVVVVFQYMLFVQTRGVLLRNRLRANNIEMSASLSAVFSVPTEDLPLQSDVIGGLRQAFNHSSFKLLRDEPGAGGRVGRLEVFVPSAGERVEIDTHSVVTGTPEDRDEMTTLTVTIPPARRTVRTLRRLAEGSLSEVVGVVSPMMSGTPDALRLDAAFVGLPNPYFGLILRDELSRSSVSEFRARIAPQTAGQSETVLIERDALHMSARTERDFVRALGEYLGFRMAGSASS